MTYPAYVHRNPAAIVERPNDKALAFHRVEPVRDVPIYRPEPRK